LFAYYPSWKDIFMIEIKESERGEEIDKNLGEVLDLPLVKDQYVEVATLRARPDIANMLNVAFVSNDSEAHDLVGINVFGKKNCIGIVLCEDNFEEVWDRAKADEKLGDFLAQGASIALISRSEVIEWANYYKQIDEMGISEILGAKALEVSGLDRTTPEQHVRLQMSLQEVLERNAQYFANFEVRAVPDAYGLDIGLVGDTGSLQPVPLYHVRLGQMDGDVLVETICEDPVSAPGFVVRHPWENKRDAYLRAEAHAQVWRKKLRRDDLVIPVISDGQLSLWKKLGIADHLKTNLADTDVNAEELIRFLYLGKSNIEPGELARLGFSLPSAGGEFGGVDIVLYDRDARNDMRMRVVNDILGEDLSKRKKGKGFGMIPVANVAGMVVVPEDWDVETRKKHIEKQRYYLNFHKYGPNVHLLYVTRTLLDAWKERGSVIASEQDFGADGQAGAAKEFSSLERMWEYGYGVGHSAQVYMDIWRPKAEIGGIKMIMSEVSQTGVVYHIMDWGTSFNVIPEEMQNVGSQPGTAVGLRSQFETGQLPMVPGIYHADYLLATAKYFSGLMYEHDRPIVSFLRSELYSQVSPERLEEYLGVAMAKKIAEFGPCDSERWYMGKERLVAEVINSHAHVDHCGDVPYLKGNIYGRTETIAHLMAMSARSRSWRNEYDAWSLLSQPKIGSAYEREYRGMIPLHWDNQRVRSSVNVAFEQHLINHSITGTAMTGFYRADGGGGVLYTADVKMGEATQKTVTELAGQFDTIIMETTNFEEGKVSAGRSEATVRESMLRLVRQNPKDAIIVVAPPNHLERLTIIRQVAEMTGRRLAIGNSHALNVNQMRIARSQAPLDVEGFMVPLPEVGEDVALWQRSMISPQTYERVLREIASGKSLGLVDHERLSREGDKWIVVVTPYDSLRYMFGGVYFKNLSVIHSAPFPYAQQAKVRLADNQKWIKSVSGKYFTDFNIQGYGGRVQPSNNPYYLHVSGHVTFEQMVDQVVQPLLGGVYKDKTLILVHGQHPAKYAEAMRERMGNPEGLKIVSNIDRYRPDSPMTAGGFRIRVG
jgi:mRNA degradation ribonuclease J1/J2